MVPDTLHTEADSAEAGAPGDERAEAALRELLDLVLSGPSPSRFYREALEHVAAAMGTPHAMLEVSVPGSLIEHEVASGSQRPDFWRAKLHGHLAETLSDQRPHARLFESSRLKSSIAFLGVPIPDPKGRCIGALALVVASRDAQEAREQLTFLHCTSLVLAGYAETPPEPAAPAASTGSAGGGPSGAKLLERLASFSSPTQLAFEITNKIRNRASCTQVALARVRKQRLELLSISGLDDYKRHSPQVNALQAAMEECLDLGAPIVSQDAGEAGGAPARHLLHEQWRKTAGGASSVASIPLALEGGRGAILALRRTGGQRFSTSELDEVAALVEPYVAGMGFVERANRSLAQHALGSLRQALRGWRSRREVLTKVLYALPAALVLFLAFGRLPYAVTAPCVLVPSAVHNVSAPFDAVLRSAERVAGDRVREGELLASFDTTELVLERRELQSELEITGLRHRAALADGAAVEVALTDARRRQLQGQLAVVEHELERSTIRAPLDGILLTGDLRERVGDQLVRGEPLFRISPTRDWKVEVEVPERHVVYLEAGQAGSFASRARPEESHELTLRRVLPSAEEREGATVYVAEAEIASQVDWLLAGMEGLARIETPSRPAWWVLFHGALDRLRMSFWL